MKTVSPSSRFQIERTLMEGLSRVSGLEDFVSTVTLHMLSAETGRKRIDLLILLTTPRKGYSILVETTGFQSLHNLMRPLVIAIGRHIQDKLQTLWSEPSATCYSDGDRRIVVSFS